MKPKQTPKKGGGAPIPDAKKGGGSPIPTVLKPPKAKRKRGSVPMTKIKVGSSKHAASAAKKAKKPKPDKEDAVKGRKVFWKSEAAMRRKEMRSLGTSKRGRG